MVELRRELGLKEVIATVVTAVVGGGLFISTIQIQSKVPVGSSIIFSYILAAIPAFFMALCYAVLSSALPSSGGEYVFVSRIVDPFVGFISTWARWFAMIATIAAMAVGDIVLIDNFFDILGMHSVSYFISTNITMISIILVIIFMFVNYLGVKTFGRIQTIMFVLLMIGIGLFILFGLSRIDINNISYSMNLNLDDIAKASSLIFFSYLGFAAIANAGGEIKKPEKTLPKGIVISMFMIAAIYILVALITYGLMSPSFLFIL
ncbi:MAG TPA: amino acid permease [Thermoplasmatales archaeon]|nr:amino acid permease [Thermoplasmatales archaeon]